MNDIYYPDYLYHYGIKGQKWGVRRFQKKDGTLTSEGKKRYSEDSDSKKTDDNQSKDVPQKEKKQLTRKQKAAIAGAAIVAAYATYKFIDSGKANQLIAKGRAALGHTEPDGFNKNILLANKRLDSDGIMETVVSRINPDYGGVGTKNNCRRCTFAYEMSRRGYDVKATKSLTGTGQNGLGLGRAMSKKITGFWSLVNETAFNPDSDVAQMVNKGKGFGTKKVPKLASDEGFAKSIFHELSGYKNGARGELAVEWAAGGRHSMAWEIVKGKPVIFDCQTGKKYDTPDMFKDLGDSIIDAGTTRLDNLDLNKDFLLRWLQNA